MNTVENFESDTNWWRRSPVRFLPNYAESAGVALRDTNGEYRSIHDVIEDIAGLATNIAADTAREEPPDELDNHSFEIVKSKNKICEVEMWEPVYITWDVFDNAVRTFGRVAAGWYAKVFDEDDLCQFKFLAFDYREALHELEKVHDAFSAEYF